MHEIEDTNHHSVPNVKQTMPETENQTTKIKEPLAGPTISVLFELVQHREIKSPCLLLYLVLNEAIVSKMHGLITTKAIRHLQQLADTCIMLSNTSVQP